jgi:uncharacterized protein
MNTPPPLTDQDLERLDTLLETRAIPHDGMSLEMLDGFMSALIVSPSLVMPSEYLPVIWNHEPDWSSLAEATEAMNLVMGLWNDIVSRLQIQFDENDPDAHAEAMPLLAYPPMSEPSARKADGADTAAEYADPFADAPSDFPLGAAWALGFLRGVSMRQDQWERWASEHESVDDDLGMLETLALFSPEQAEELGLDPEGIPTFTDRLDMVADLPAMLQDLNALRLEQHTAGQRPVVRKEQPGRNDECPCGSGKKFKKCCGAPGSVH